MRVSIISMAMAGFMKLRAGRIIWSPVLSGVRRSQVRNDESNW